MNEQNNKKTLYEKVKNGLKTTLITYCVLGSTYGLGVQTTGHVSSDIYTGIAKPTKLERIIVENLFGLSLTNKINKF